jgi:hypothetical protein
VISWGIYSCPLRRRRTSLFKGPAWADRDGQPSLLSLSLFATHPAVDFTNVRAP